MSKQPEKVEDGAWDEGKRGLKPMHKLFVMYYLGEANGDPVRAYEMAGYPVNKKTDRDRARALLSMPAIQAAISANFSRFLLKPEWAKSRLAAMANVSMANFLDENGNIDMAKAAALGAMDQIKEMEVITDSEGNVLRRKIKLHDRFQPMVTLLRVIGVLQDRVKLEADDETKLALTSIMNKARDDDGIQEKIRQIAEIMYPVGGPPKQLSNTPVPEPIVVKPEKTSG